MRAVFVDSSVLLLAVGGEHPLRGPCRGVLDLAGRDVLGLHLSVEGGQEFLFHRLRRGARDEALAQFAALDRLVTWHPFDAEILRASVRLVADCGLRGRDAVHAATALAAGFHLIFSCDEDFDAVPGLTRVDPRDLS